MLVISVVHQKGGVGKTTLTLNLAYCLAENLKVCIADTDLQNSISEIEDFIVGIDLIPLEKLKDKDSLPYDVLLVDTPPYHSNRLHEILLLSDFVLIPIRAGYLEALAVKGTIALVNAAKKEKPTLKTALVLNMVMHNTNLNEEVKEILRKYEISILNTEITQRVSFARSPITGGIFKSDDNRAKTEIQNLTNEILDTLYN